MTRTLATDIGWPLWTTTWHGLTTVIVSAVACGLICVVAATQLPPQCRVIFYGSAAALTVIAIFTTAEHAFIVFLFASFIGSVIGMVAFTHLLAWTGLPVHPWADQHSHSSSRMLFPFRFFGIVAAYYVATVAAMWLLTTLWPFPEFLESVV